MRVVAEHWLEVHDPRGRLKSAFKRSNCPPTTADSLPKPDFHVLGTVVNGVIAYLLYERDDDVPIDLTRVGPAGPRMLILRHGLDQWWVLPQKAPTLAR